MSRRVLFPEHSMYSCGVKNDDTSAPRPEKDAETKKPYEPPVLVRWGTLHELTQSVGSLGASDGGHKGNRNRTSN
jgi:hypothetical protein